jgi:hypothetical protein
MTQPLQILRVNKSKHQHFKDARHQKGRPSNPHHSLSQHVISPQKEFLAEQVRMISLNRGVVELGLACLFLA